MWIPWCTLGLNLLPCSAFTNSSKASRYFFYCILSEPARECQYEYITSGGTIQLLLSSLIYSYPLIKSCRISIFYSMPESSPEFILQLMMKNRHPMYSKFRISG